MKTIELLFYQTNPSEENKGIKNVLWEVSDGKSINYDWGFAVWNGTDWDEIETPDGYSAKVHSWANCVNPAKLLKEESKIIRI